MNELQQRHKMTTRNKRKMKTPVVVLEKDRVLPSLAFKALSGNALKIFMVMRAETFGYLYGNPPDVCSSEIKLAYSLLMEATGLHTRTISRCLVELENVGFIDRTKQGGVYGGGKQTSIYHLSMRFMDYGTNNIRPGQ